MSDTDPKEIIQYAERSLEHLHFILAAAVSWAEQKKLDKRYKNEFRKLPPNLKKGMEKDEELSEDIYVQALASHIFSSNFSDSFIRFFKRILKEDWWELNYRPEGVEPKELIESVERFAEYTWFMTVVEVNSIVEKDLLYVRDLDDNVVSLLYSPAIYDVYMREMEGEEDRKIYFGGLFLNDEHCLLVVGPAYSYIAFNESDFSIFAEKLDPDWYGKYGMSSVFTRHPVTFTGLPFYGDAPFDEFILNPDGRPRVLHQVAGEFARDLSPEGLSSRVSSPFSIKEQNHYFEISVDEGDIFTTPVIFGDWKEKKVWLKAFTDEALALGRNYFSGVFTFPETADVETSVAMWIAIFDLLKDKNPPGRIERIFYPEPPPEKTVQEGTNYSDEANDFFGLHPELVYRILRNPGVEKVQDLLRLEPEAFERTVKDAPFVPPMYMGLIKIIKALSEEEGDGETHAKNRKPSSKNTL